MNRRSVVSALGMIALAAGCATAPARPQATPEELEQLRASLEALFMAQEIYYSHPDNNLTYASDLARVARYRRTTPGDVRITILEGTERGWAAIAQLESGTACAFYVGQVRSTPKTPRGTTATEPKKPACDED